MVRRIFFNTAIILGLNELVSGSTTKIGAVNTSPSFVGFELLSIASPTLSYELSNVPSASNDLPQPPTASTDKFNNASVLLPRNPADFMHYNAHTPRYEMRKIPSGLQRFYEDIKGEIAGLNEGQVDESVREVRSDTLLTLFGHIVNDRVEQFHNFEPEFQRIFGTSYGRFSSAGRSVLGWLVAFGSSEILRSLDLQKFNIESSNLDVSIKYFVEIHLFSHIAYVLMAAPFLIKTPLQNGQNFLHYVKNRPNGTPIENLASLFVELPTVSLALIVALIPNTADANPLTGLLSDIHKITSSIKTSINFIKTGVIHEKAVKNIKSALQLFLSRCINNFLEIQQGDRFTVASLFIEAENSDALKRLLDAQPDMLETLGNGKSILQICIDESSIACAGVVARLRPELITQSNNGLHSPLVQAIMCDNAKIFDLFLPLLSSNDPVDFFGSEVRMRPTTIVMILGKVGILKQIVSHFTENNIPFDLRVDLENAMDYLEKEFVKSKGARLRENTLIDHSLWIYLIEEAEIINDHPANSYDPLRRSLLDLAVIDRNPKVAKLLIEKFGTHIVNQTCNDGPFQGNCLRFYKHDLNMLKVLVNNGIDINTPLVITTVYEEDEESERLEIIKTTPVLVKILMFQNYDDDAAALEYIKSLNFSRDALEYAFEFSRQGQLGIPARVAIELLEQQQINE
jgi:hypothetical protein